MNHAAPSAGSGPPPPAPPIAHARFSIGDVVKHRMFEFRGVVFDVDPVFANTDEWYEAIPEDLRPRKDQPFYHLLAENAESSYVAYVSQQNLVADESEEPVDHPAISGLFDRYEKGGTRSGANTGIDWRDLATPVRAEPVEARFFFSPA